MRDDEHDNATPGQDQLMRYGELRRHTGNDADRLTPQGAADAEAIGRGRLHPPYAAFVSTGAARATQMLEPQPSPWRALSASCLRRSAVRHESQLA